jgi:hypothetical protein
MHKNCAMFESALVADDGLTELALAFYGIDLIATHY